MQDLPSVMGLLFASVCCAPFAAAQDFPTKTLRVMAANIGGTSDQMARLAAQALSANLGQPAVVLNRPGRQVISVLETAKSAPDGYTLLAVGANQFWLVPFMQKNVPYDPVKDFLPVTLLSTSPNLVVVHPGLPATNIRELIAHAKANPGKLNFGIGNYGNAGHLAGQLFLAMSQTNIVTVPYKGTAPAMNAVLAGEVQLSFPTVSSALPAAKAGRLRALAVTTARPTPLAPGIPTVNESGLPGYESSVFYAVFVPAKTPATIVGVLNRAIVRHLQSPDIKDKMFAGGLEIVASSPQELATAMKRDRERMGKVILDAGIQSEE